MKIQLLLYIVKLQSLKFFSWKKDYKKVKKAKLAHAFNNYAHTYNVETLNSFNPELHLKKTESAIKNKLKKLLNEMKGIKFVITLVLEFKKKTKKKQ